MQALLNPTFWMAAVALYPLQYLPTRLRRSMQFGIFNLVIVTLLLGPRAMAVAAGFTVFVWGCAHLARPRSGKECAAAALGTTLSAVAVIAVTLVAYKLIKDSPEWLGSVCTRQSCNGSLFFQSLLAVSFSYAALRCVDCVVSVSSGAELLDPLSLFGYLFAFHMLVAGPICLYRDHLKIDREAPAKVDFMRLLDAASVVTTGLLYKFVVAESLRMYRYGVGGAVSAESWVDSGFVLIYLFFDFAGYSLVALGIGRLCGVPTPVNFRAPFKSKTVTEFFTRWHISLGDFIRKNVFIPMQAHLVRRFGLASAGLVAFATMAGSFLVVGLWHRLTLSFLAWGLFLGLVMGLEKVVIERARRSSHWRGAWTRRLTAVLGPVYVFCVVTTSVHLVVNDVL